MPKIPEKVNLLYIEDDVSISKLMVKYLSKSKHTKFNIIIKNTLKDGLEYLNDCLGLDAVLLDLILPNSKGVDTFNSVNKQCGYLLPIIIISGFEDIACKCVKLGAQDYLFKPDITPGLLVRSIKYSIERKKVKDKLKQERNVSQKYLDIAEVMFVALDKKQNVTLVNKKTCEILGYKEKEIVGKNWFDNFLPKSLIPEIKKVYNKIISGDEKAYKFHGNPVLSKDGSEKYISWHNSVIKDRFGNIAGVLSSGEDVTDHRRAQEIIIQSEKKFRELVEVTKASIYEIDFVNNKFVYVNDYLCEQSGYTREELMKLAPSEILTKESAEKWTGRMVSLSNGEYISSSTEYEVVRKDGIKGWVLITAKFIEDNNNNVTGANVVAINITDRKLAEEALNKKEESVYIELEGKIRDWREEIVIRNIERNEKLDLINTEIKSMTEMEII